MNIECLQKNICHFSFLIEWKHLRISFNKSMISTKCIGTWNKSLEKKLINM